MTLAAQVQTTIHAISTTSAGAVETALAYPLTFFANVGDCTTILSDTRTFPAAGYEDIDLSASGLEVVKLFALKNLSTDSSIAISAGWDGSQFSNFLVDTLAWNFSPMINLGSLTLRGYPIRPLGAHMLSCPNSDGFSTTSGGSIVRIGGVEGEQYQIYVMGS